MTFSHALWVVVLCAITGSFTWGMRGTILGGERGAMLPGAALSLVLLQAGGVQMLSDLFPMAATVGAAGMFFGGWQTYGETIGMTFDADAGIRRFARFGLAIKGAGWFGVFGGILAFAMGAWSGRFALWQVILFTALLPVAQFLGTLAFNFPQKPEQNRFPKIYFSKTRREVWGGLLFVCIDLCVFGCILREWLMPLLTAFGMASGALGFWIGNLFQTAVDKDRDAANDKGLFARLRQTGVVSGWKGMECILGAVGGIGLGVAWCLFYKPLVQNCEQKLVLHNGVWDAFPGKTDNILLFVWFALFALFVLRYMVPADRDSFVYKLEDVFIWPVFCYIPLFLAACGNLPFSRIFSVSVLFYLLAEKVAFAGTERFETIRGAKILQAILIVLTAVLLALQLFTRVRFDMYATFLLCILAYVFVYGYSLAADALDKEKGLPSLRASAGWSVWAAVCACTMLIAGRFYFV